MKRILVSVAAITAMVLSLSLPTVNHARAVADGQKASDDKSQVKIDNFSFVPATLTVTAGSTVTWVNQDDVPHNIVSSEGKTLKSPVLDTDQKFSYTFDRPGTYEYFCGIHPRMIGKIIVQASGDRN
ncbi:MAG TPA: cupredoxin family copper-binding protein [Terriglobia bacterium]|nr:cupredoxin family copper-binding protein [Terriglobia bacterium]